MPQFLPSGVVRIKRNDVFKALSPVSGREGCLTNVSLCYCDGDDHSTGWCGGGGGGGSCGEFSSLS